MIGAGGDDGQWLSVVSVVFRNAPLPPEYSAVTREDCEVTVSKYQLHAPHYLHLGPTFHNLA